MLSIHNFLCRKCGMSVRILQLPAQATFLTHYTAELLRATYYKTQVNAPRLNHSQTGRYSTYPYSEKRRSELTWCGRWYETRK